MTRLYLHYMKLVLGCKVGLPLSAPPHLTRRNYRRRTSDRPYDPILQGGRMFWDTHADWPAMGPSDGMPAPDMD